MLEPRGTFHILEGQLEDWKTFVLLFTLACVRCVVCLLNCFCESFVLLCGRRDLKEGEFVIYFEGKKHLDLLPKGHWNMFLQAYIMYT